MPSFMTVEIPSVSNDNSAYPSVSGRVFSFFCGSNLRNVLENTLRCPRRAEHLFGNGRAEAGVRIKSVTLSAGGNRLGAIRPQHNGLAAVENHALHVAGAQHGAGLLVGRQVGVLEPEDAVLACGVLDPPRT